MPQSRNVRVNEISQHPEHTAERTGASHLNQEHERPQENERTHSGHVPDGHTSDGYVPPAQQHEGVPPRGKNAPKK